MIDIDEIRRAQIAAHRLTKADAEYVFYHDETNNIRKLHLAERDFNVAQPGCFALGGIVHEGHPYQLDITSLRHKMRIQASTKELKLKHIGKGGFLDLIKSDKLAAFLQWVTQNDLLIHYHVLDPLYWSFIDIMDSILYKLAEPHLMAFHIHLKADLNKLLRVNLHETANLLYRYNYPDVAPESPKHFIDELIMMLEQSGDVLPGFNSMMLKGTLQAGRNLTSLDFIQGFTPRALIDSFAIFYLTRIAVFKNSVHILDMEDSMKSELDALQLVSEGKALKNYWFVNSKCEVGIQVSDILVGLIGKMYSYFAETAYNEVAATRETLSGVSLKNVELLRDIIDASHEANIAFINHVVSNHEINKMNKFLRLQGRVIE